MDAWQLRQLSSQVVDGDLAVDVQYDLHGAVAVGLPGPLPASREPAVNGLRGHLVDSEPAPGRDTEHLAQDVAARAGRRVFRRA